MVGGLGIGYRLTHRCSGIRDEAYDTYLAVRWLFKVNDGSGWPTKLHLAYICRLAIDMPVALLSCGLDSVCICR